MTFAPSIAGQAWLASPDVHAVMDALGQARLVGGCVRNSLLGLDVDDIDIATPLTPDAVARAVGARGMKAIDTGAEHGTLTVVLNSRPFEVTTLRRDVSTDGRRATVAFTTVWEEDAARRDCRGPSSHPQAVSDPRVVWPGRDRRRGHAGLSRWSRKDPCAVR